MSTTSRIKIQSAYQPLLSTFGPDGAWVFDSPQVVAWRKLEDRENCTLDAAWPDGRAVRLHVKRYPAKCALNAASEAAALADLSSRQIPCASLVAAGHLTDGRAFVITEDLAGYEPADKLIAAGASFEKFIFPTADLAARLHAAGFHHRDLYLCHFMARISHGPTEVKLIDATRVRRLPGWPMRQRWVVKDLAQFWYSMTQLKIAEADQSAWLARYAAQRKIAFNDALRRRVKAKARRIAAHDVNLNRREPARHVSIPR